MYTVFTRLIIRLAVLFFGVFSVFYFYVLGYKYDSKIGFVKSSGVYNIKYYSTKNLEDNILINGSKYYFVSNKLTLYNMPTSSCGELKIGDLKQYKCYDDRKFNNIVHIPKTSVKVFPSSANLFLKLDLYTSENPFLKYNFSWNGIDFFYYTNGDLIYEDDISSKKLVNIPNIEFIGHDSGGLYFSSGGKLNFLAIMNNL